ncbi:isonitrile hydratase [Abditibacteriota bacterium]|nr:isonitrile hydratase [Abditibacteriota bacterium]
MKFHLVFSSATALFLCFVLTAHAQMAMPKTKAPQKTLNVALFVYPGVEALDMSGALDVFVKANRVAPRSFNVFTVALNCAPLKTEADILTLTPRFDVANCPHPDIVIVPGASPERVAQVSADERVQSWLRRNATPRQTVMSVCTGAFIVARAGLLNGKNSTTHWFVLSDFQRQFPKTKAYSGVRFVRDGNVISTAGISSGIDGALQLVEDTRGKQTADLVARALQYRRGTPSYPEQVHARVRVQSVSATRRPGQKLALDQDPVCHMKVRADTINTFMYKGKLYGFCSPGCRDAFAAHPEQFLKTK